MRALAAAAAVLLLGCTEGKRESNEDVPRRYRKASEPVAIQGTPRERDCAEVRTILAHPFALPDRSDTEHGAGIFDPAPIEKLKRLTYHDAEVREAALAVARDAPTLFYAGSAGSADWSSVDRLTALCNLPTAK